MCDHPNLGPSKDALAVLELADEASRQYRSGAARNLHKVLHAEASTVLSTVFTFTVAFGGGCRQYWVTSAGFIGVRDGRNEYLKFLNLNECDSFEVQGILNELRRCFAQLAHT